jgi:hypothetical protein
VTAVVPTNVESHDVDASKKLAILRGSLGPGGALHSCCDTCLVGL